jgi:pyruvate/2-oxoglutarate dehydrogenase complex dihydrolipoamide acyltransferase (E2) component
VPPSAPRKWLRWLGGLAVLAAVIVYMNGKPGGKNESACNDAIDSGLKLVANGSLDGARQKLATAKTACTGKSSAKADDLQAAISKAGAGSGACQRSVRAIERAIDGHQLQGAVKGLAALDADCAGAASVDSLRKQLARQQAAAASVLVGVRQALDGKDVAAAQNGIARLEAIDREAVELPQLKADVQAMSVAAAPAPVPVPAPAPAQQEPAPARVVERSTVAERRPADAAPVDTGAAMRNDMAQSFLRDAERSLLEGKFDAAKTYLDSARRVDPGNARIDNLSRRIRERERQVLQTETTIN